MGNNNILINLTNEELFDLYYRTKDIEVKQEIVMRYREMVKTIAVQLRGVYISFAEIDDIINEGIITLMQAVDRFDPAKNVKFESYASLRIRGAIVDLARKQDWVPRNVRKLGKDIDNAYAELYYRFGRYPSDEEIAEFLDIPITKYYKILGETNMFNILSLDALIEASQEEGQHEKFMRDPDSDYMPSQRLEQKELESMLKASIEALRENEKKVVSLYYIEELNMRNISEVMGISEPRVSQLHASALKKLKLSMSKFIGA